MIVLIEGLDRTGKSSLARELANDLDCEIVHSARPTRHPLDEYVKPHQRVTTDYHLVLDRGHIGELVWPKIFRRESEMDEPARRYIEMFLRSRDAIVIYARRDYDELVTACARDGEDVDGRVAESVARFEDALTGTRPCLPVFRHTHGDDVSYVALMARVKPRYLQSLFALTPRWVGSPRPRILLVGEQVGPGSPDWELPFVPYRNTSGHFLLNDIGDLANEVALVNAYRPGCVRREPISDLWEVMRRPKVVALGKVADVVLSEQGVPHGSTYHPQYVRRFLRSRGPGFLRERIVEAAT